MTMKQFFFALLALTVSSGLFAQKSAKDVAKFASETIDLGKIKQDNPTTATFEVTNIGKEPLLIEQASPTCGCTISDYTKTPIESGKSGYIKATYNAKNLGMFEKHLNVKFAGYDMQGITIKGEVIRDESAAAAPAAAAAASSSMSAAPLAEPQAEVAEKAVPASATKAAATKSTSTVPAKKTATSSKVKKP